MRFSWKLCPNPASGKFSLLPKQSTHRSIPASKQQESDCVWHDAISWKTFPERGYLHLLHYWIEPDRKHKSSGRVQISMWMCTHKEGDRAHVYCRLIMRDKLAAFLGFSNQVSPQINTFKSNEAWGKISFLTPSPTTQVFSLIAPDWIRTLQACTDRDWLRFPAHSPVSLLHLLALDNFLNHSY